MQNDIAIVILAAGNSNRMGQPKQLLPWGETTLLAHSIETVSACGSIVFVVLGAYRDEIIGSIDLTEVIEFEYINWKEGIGSTISFAVKEIEQRYNAIKGIIITLADQPFIDKGHYRELIRQYITNKECIIATENDSYLGVPALFPKAFFKELKTLSNDEGAKKIILKKINCVRKVRIFTDTFDIDTIEAYNTAKKINSDRNH